MLSVSIGNKFLTLIFALRFTSRLLIFKIRIGIELAGVINPPEISTPSLSSTKTSGSRIDESSFISWASRSSVYPSTIVYKYGLIVEFDVKMISTVLRFLYICVIIETF